MNLNWPTQKDTANQLELAIKKPAHGYIFSGNSHSGMYSASLIFAARMLGMESYNQNHPNLNIISTSEDKKTIGIAQIHDLVREVNQTTYVADKPRIVIIKNADTMSTEAATALLKTLEEPPEKVIFILTTNNMQALLPTIRSRATSIIFKPMSKPELASYLELSYQVSQDQSLKLADISEGMVDLAITLLDEESLQQFEQLMQLAKKFTNTAISEKFIIAKQISEQQKTIDFLEKLYYATDTQSSILVIASNQENILAAEKQIRTNVNPRLVLENLALQWSS